MTNKSTHRDIKYCDDDDAPRMVNDSHFRTLTPLGNDTYEVEPSKKTIKLDLPLHIGFFVYQYAKMKILQFYFDCLDVFVDRRDLQLCQGDTNSLYLALSARTLDEVIKPEKKREFYETWPKWFPAEACDEHHAAFMDAKCCGDEWTPTQQCCIDRKQFDKRTPGLFKVGVMLLNHQIITYG